MSEAVTTEAPDLRTLKLSEIRVYENNPRRISQKAIDSVALSIQQYGYVQPIVVDTDNVIVVGHTRYAALQQLGFEEIEVQVMPAGAKADEFRLVDNRTSEMGEWDHKALALELREFDAELLADFFPEVDLNVVATAASDVTEKDMLEAADKIERVAEMDPRTAHMTTVVCPNCYHEFDVRTKTLPGLTWEFLEGLIADGTEA